MSDYPYPGLRPFLREESDIFFGREEQVDELLEKLGDGRLLTVMGPSGCGKSSLVFAGLIPGLETGFLASAGARWRITSMRPGDRPLLRLAEALVEPLELAAGDGDPEVSAAFLRSDLERGPLGLVEVLEERPLPEGTNLLVVVDQFEEIFRYREQGDSNEAAAFVSLLLETTRHTALNVYVVLTMRSEYLGDCAVFRGLPEAINRAQYLTPQLSRRQLEAAIRGPAGVFGARIEPALVTRLLNDMGSESDQLPLMQHALMRIWMLVSRRSPERDESRSLQLSVADYVEVGELKEALSRHMDSVFELLDAEGQRVAELMFRALSERGPHRDTRRPTALREVAEIADVGPATVAEVVKAFRKPGRSFVTPPAGTPLGPDKVLDISHESLIRQWRRMRGWVDEDGRIRRGWVEEEARSALIYRRLEETATLWRNRKAGLWSSPDLDIALTWKKREQPTEAWARRYGGNFVLSMQFLNRSLWKRRLLHGAAFAALGLLALVVVGWVTLVRRNRAETWIVGRAALPGAMVSHSQLELKRHNHELSALIALEAYQAKDVVGDAVKEFPPWVISDRKIREITAALPQALVVDNTALDHALRGSLAPNPFSHRLLGHRGVVRAVAFSPDGRWLASGGGEADMAVRLWRRGSPSALACLNHEGVVRTVAFSHDSSWLAVAGTKSEAPGAPAAGVHLYSVQALSLPERATDVEPRCEERIPSHRLPTASGRVRSVAFHPTAPLLAAGDGDGRLSLWQLTDAGDWAERGSHRLSGEIRSLAFSPADGEWLAAGASDGTVRLWHLTAGAGGALEAKPVSARRGLSGHRLPAEVRADRNVRSVAFGYLDGELRLASAGPFELDGLAYMLAAGGELLLGYDDQEPVGGPVGEVQGFILWRVDLESCRRSLAGAEQGRCLSVLRQVPHDSTVRSLAFDAQSGHLYGSTSNGEVLRWPASRLTMGLGTLGDARVEPDRLAGHKGWVFQVAAAPGGGRLASAAEDRTVRTWQWRQDRDQTDLVRYDAPVRAIGFGPEAAGRVAVADADGRVWLRRAGSEGLAEEPPEELEPKHDAPVRAVSVSPDGSLAASASSDSTVRLWRLDEPDRPSTTLQLTEEEGVWGLAFVPAPAWQQRRWLAAGGYGEKVHIWDVGGPQPRPLAVFDVSGRTGHKGHKKSKEAPAVRSLAFNHDGSMLAAALWNGHVLLWQLGDDPVAAEPTVLGFQDSRGQPTTWNDDLAFGSVSFGPVSGRLAAGSWDGTVRVWDPSVPDCPQFVLSAARNDVSALAFSSDESHLASGHRVGAVVLWELPPAGEPRAAAGGCVERVLEQKPLIFEGGGEGGHAEWVYSVAFHPGGFWLLSGGQDSTLRRWEVTRNLADAVCERVERNLTPSEWSEIVGDQFDFECSCPKLPCLID